MLMAAAKQEAANGDHDVYFIPATAFDGYYRDSNFHEQEYILDLAVQQKFHGTNVKVPTIKSMREALGERTMATRTDMIGDLDNYHHLLRKYITKISRGNSVKVYIRFG